MRQGPATLRRWGQRLRDWYLDHYRLVALIEVPPISGSMAPLPLLLGLGDGPDTGGPPGGGGGRYFIFQRRRR